MVEARWWPLKLARCFNFRRLLRELTENKAVATSERRASKFRNEVQNSKVRVRERERIEAQSTTCIYEQRCRRVIVKQFLRKTVPLDARNFSWEVARIIPCTFTLALLHLFIYIYTHLPIYSIFVCGEGWQGFFAHGAIPLKISNNFSSVSSVR